jgi:nicotinate phosphoribosyltransferase
MIHHDRLGLMTDTPNADEFPLLQRVMQQGQMLQLPEPLTAIAGRTTQSVKCLPSQVRQVNQPVPMTVELSQELQALVEQTQSRNLKPIKLP